jgi:hypothetical protein
MRETQTTPVVRVERPETLSAEAACPLLAGSSRFVSSR